MDCVARDYPILNLESFIEANIRLQRTKEDDTEENNPATFLKGICCHVQNLYLFAETLEVLTFCCSKILQFIKLSNLDIENNFGVGWESLPNLLTNCPNLETLTFRGLVHLATESCGDMCLCNGLERIPSFLSTSPVKILQIHERGEANKDAEAFLKQVTHFLMTMPNLKQVVIYSHESSDVVALTQLAKTLEMISEKASLVCKIQVLPDNT
ncbi:unnamed protein product [Cochlearia groenlandica]